MSISALLNQRCTIERATVGENDGPRPKEVWTAAAEEVPCRVVTLRGEEMSGGNTNSRAGRAEVTVLTHRVMFDYGQDVTARDRLIVGAAVYDVESVDPDPGGQRDHVEAMCQEVR
ncbi:MAG: head-tail adaptor protein [bacterium]|nr:head-tail adaptor protein [bacterium]